jgi:Mrp family chromosome partitioning ATPase
LVYLRSLELRKDEEFEAVTEETMKNSPSGMSRRVGLVNTDVSEERIPSMFRVEKSTSKEKGLAIANSPLGAANIFLRSRIFVRWMRR